MAKGCLTALGHLLALAVFLVLLPLILGVSIAVFAVVGALAVLTGRWNRKE